MLRKSMKIVGSAVVLAAVLIFSGTGVKAQSVADIQLTITIAPMDIIKLQDLIKLDPASSGGTSRILFTINFNNPTASDIVIPTQAISLRPYKDGKWLGFELANGSEVTVAAGQRLTLNNRNYSRFDITASDFALQPILDAIFGLGTEIASINPSGPVPAGEYSFEVEIEGGQSASASLFLSNPTGYVQLLGPGVELGSGEFNEITTRQPFITWIGDAPKFRLLVVEKGSNDFTVNDLLSKNAHLDVEVTGNSLQYPSAGVRPLEAGKTYVILLTSQVRTFGSNVPSSTFATPYEFKITESQTATENASSDFVQALINLFGPDYEEVFKLLEGGKVTGGITLDGQTISVAALRKIAADMRAGTITVQTIRVQ